MPRHPCIGLRELSTQFWDYEHGSMGKEIGLALIVLAGSIVTVTFSKLANALK